ncbi:MAG: transporter substrate-binding domain-containing protein [Vicinamibacterales bacterium]
MRSGSALGAAYAAALVLLLSLPVVPAAWAQDNRTLVFVGDRDYPPVSYRDEAGPHGLDPEVVEAIGRRLDRPTRFDAIGFDDAQVRVLDGRADAITDFGILPERREQFDFTDAVLTHEFVFYTRIGDRSVRGVADLAGKRIACFPYMFATSFLQRQGYQPMGVPDLRTAFTRLAAGELDVLAVDNWAAAPVARAFRGQVHQVGTPFATVATAIALRKGRPELVAQLNAAIRAIKADGTLDAIERRWRPDELLFLPTQSVRQWTLAGVALVMFAAMAVLGAWIAQMRRQMRTRESAAVALAASEDKFSKVFRASPEAMMIGRRLAPLPRRERSVPRHDRLHDRRRAWANARRARDCSDPGARDCRSHGERSGGSQRGVADPGTRGGRLMTVVTSAERIVLDGREALLATHRDVTEARQVEAQLRQAQKMEAVGRLSASVAHDFNNLLTVIIGNCDLVLTGTSPVAAATRDAVEEIRHAGQHAAALTGQLLMFSRRGATRVETVDVNDTLRAMSKMLGRLLGDEIEMKWQLDEAAHAVRADSVELQQVVLNLAVNARDAMPSGGRLTVSTAASDSPPGEPAAVDGETRLFTRLSVSDTGIGMDADTRAHLFEPFFTTKPVGQGTGLGLSTVYGIVSRMGGHIDVDSAPGAGTTFRIWLPAVSEMPQSMVTPLPAATPKARRGRIWVVDDAREVRDLIARSLNAAGYTATTFDEPEQALAAADTGADDAPDLVIADVVLPGRGGMQVAEELRRRFAGLRVLYVSGYAEPTTIEREDGRTDLLRKPFVSKELLSAVDALLDGASRN